MVAGVLISPARNVERPMSALKTPTRPKTTVRTRSKRGSDPLDIYLREVESHDLLSREEEQDLLRRLVQARDAWAVSFMHTEGALEAVWADLQAWERNEMAASSLVPGPPRLKPGQVGPEHHVPRLYKLISQHVERTGDRPFRYAKRRQTKRLVRALLFIGLRPRPMERYKEAAIERHGESVRTRVDKARRNFLEIRRPLVERNLRLVLKVAWGYVPGPMSFDELIQEGNFGLIRATESFNGRFQVRFSTYAYLWIRQSIIRALEEKSRMIRLPVHLTHLLRKVNREREEGKEIPDEIRYQGKRYKVPQILANPTVTGGMASLDAPRANDDVGFADSIPDQREDAPENPMVRRDYGQFIRGALDILPSRLRKVIKMRFGIDHARPHTLGEIGEALGVSSERIRQLQEEALEALRNSSARDSLEEIVLD